MRHPTILVSGGLGSGKTTLIKAIAAANPGCRFGVLVNEFGEVGIDGDLLRPHVPRVIEIRNGCLCCVTQDQLVPGIKEMLRSYSVDVLLIEMSGAAEPSPVIRQLGLLATLIELRAHAVLVDATADPDAATRDWVLRKSLAIADVVAVTKTDIASVLGVARWMQFLESFNPSADLVHATQGQLPLARLMQRRARTAEPAQEANAGAHDAAEHRLTNVCHFLDTTTRDRLRRFVARYGQKIARIKGIVQVDGEWAEIHAVRGDLTIEPYAGAPPSRGRIVFISSVLIQHELRDAIREGLDAALEAAVD